VTRVAGHQPQPHRYLGLIRSFWIFLKLIWRPASDHLGSGGPREKTEPLSGRSAAQTGRNPRRRSSPGYCQGPPIGSVWPVANDSE